MDRGSCSCGNDKQFGQSQCEECTGTERENSCRGEKCKYNGCGKPATHKVGEELVRGHNLTAYICEEHFINLMHGGRDARK